METWLNLLASSLVEIERNSIGRTVSLLSYRSFQIIARVFPYGRPSWYDRDDRDDEMETRPLRKLVCSLRYTLRYNACFAAVALNNRNNTVYVGFLSSSLDLHIEIFAYGFKPCHS